MVNLQELVNQRNPVTVYSPTRVLNRPRANAGTARRVLNSRAAPSWQTTGRTPSFQLGTATAGPMPSMPTSSPIDAMLARAQAPAATPTQPQQPGGFRGFLGNLVNSPVGHAAMGALTVLDYPRRIIASGVQEAADALNGGDASWDDFTRQVHEGIGFGDIIGSTGNIWLDRGIGFLGDVALDPMTYVGGAGVLAGTGREARAGLAARVLEMGLGEDLSNRVGRYGIHALSDAEREAVRRASTEAGGIFAEGAEKIKNAGYYFHFPFTEREFRLPGTGMVDRFVGGGASRARAGLASSPLGGWLRHRNTDQVLVQAINRLVAGEGDMSLAAAAEAYNWHQALTVGGKMANRQAETALKVLLKEHGTDGLDAMVRQAEESGGTALNTFFERMAKMLDDMGIDHGTIKNYVPHYYTDAGKAWLGRDTALSKEMARIFGTGKNSLEDFSPSLMKRHFVARPGDPYIINGKEFHINTGSIHEINSEFRRVTGENFDILETNAAKILSTYGEQIGGDVGRMTGVLRLLKSKTGLLRNANDASVLKAMVDDVETTLANQTMKVQLRDQLNEIGQATQQLSEELAKGLHTVGSDLLKARFGTIIDNLTSMTASDRALLEKALDVNTLTSRLLGTTSVRGEVNAGSQLLEAVRARIEPMIAKVAALDSERASLLRAAALERNQLVSALSVTKGRAAFDEIPRRLANLERYQTVTKQLLESQRDLSVVRSLHEQLQVAAAASRAAAGLSTDTSFLSQFVPGEAERVALAASVAGNARARARAIEVATSPLDPANIAAEASTARQAITNGELLPPDFVPTPEFTALTRRAEEAAQRVDVQHAAVLARTQELEAARSQYGPAVAAANANNTGVATTYQSMQAHYDNLLGEPGRDAELQQLALSMEEFRRGPVADARNQVEQASKPIRDAETALEAENRALAKMQGDFIQAARAMDEHAAIPQGAVDAADLPALPMTREESIEASRQLDRLRREQVAYERSPAGQRVRLAQEKQTAVRAEHEAVNAELAARNVIDDDGNVIVRYARNDRDYEMALARDDAQKEFDTLTSQLDSARADAKAYSLKEDGTPGQLKRLEGKARALAKRLERTAAQRDELNAQLARGEAALVRRRDRLAATDRNLTELLERTHNADEVARRDNIENLSAKLQAQQSAAQQRAQAEARMTAGEAERARRAKALAARDKAMGLTPRNEMPIARPNEARARMIDAEMRRKLAQRERTINRVTEQANTTTLGRPADIGVRALGPDDRLAWEHAQAVIRERDSFPGGESNKVVQQARRTVRELRSRIGTDVGIDTGVQPYDSLHVALAELQASRTAWKPRKTVRDLMDETARGVRTAGGDNSVQGRARAARSWGSYTATEVTPELTASGALPSGGGVFGHPDIPKFIADANNELDVELKAYGTSPTAVGKLRLENALAKVNRWSEFQLRYKAALDSGVTPSNQTATFIWSRVLGGESENLGAQIDNLGKRLTPQPVAPQIVRMQQRYGDRLPERLRASMLSPDDANEVRYLNRRYALEDAIASDEKVVRDITALEASGRPLTGAQKGQRASARNRLESNAHKLEQHQAAARVVEPGPVQNVVEHIASVITGEVQRYTTALNEARSIGHAGLVAERMAEHLNELTTSIAASTGRIEGFQRGHERLVQAVNEAVANGSPIVRWRPPVENEVRVPLDEARRMLEGGEVAFAAQPQVARALKGAQRRGDDTVSSLAFEVRGPGGVREMPLDEARAEIARNGQTLESLRQGLADDKLDKQIIDGTIHTEITAQQAIIADQMGDVLPNADELQAQLDELNARAANRHGINETGERGTPNQALGDQLTNDVDASKYMTPDEQAAVAVLGQRIEAIRRFDRMTPEQLAGAQQRLEEITAKVRSYQDKMGDRVDHVDAIADGGEAYFRQLLSGARPFTDNDAALMRDLIGPAQADVAAAFVHQVNGVLRQGETLTPQRIGQVFTVLGTDFGETPLLAEMRRAVVEAVDNGVPVTDATIRDVVAQSLIGGAQQHKENQLRNLSQLFDSLGMRFSPGVKGLAQKMTAMGYVVGSDTVGQSRLKDFITRQLEQAGVPLDAQLDDTLTQLKLRKSHVDAMRLGLGADLRNMPWETDPRAVFEATAGGRIDDEVRQFDNAVPQRANEIYAERVTDLTTQLTRARAAGDTNRVNEITDLLDDLDGRRRVDPATPPSAVEPSPPTNPQVPYEQQLASAEARSTQAANTLTEAKTRLAQAERRAALEARGISSWEPPPPGSRLAAETIQPAPVDLEAARSAVDQAETAAGQAKQELNRLRTQGPEHLSPADTPETPLGQIDDATRAHDPDAALTFDEADAEYKASMEEVDRLDAEPPSPERDQARAAAAARARKMADQRARQWPARRAELEAAQRAPEAIAPGTVTWNVWQTMTTGAPNTRYVTPPAGVRNRMVDTAFENIPTGPAGDYTAANLPELEQRVLGQLAPAEDIRQTMIEARNAAELERARIQQHLDAYEGRDIEGEIARLQAEKAGLEAANARSLGEETYLEAVKATNRRSSEVAQEMIDETARISREQSMQRQAIRDAEQAYTDQLRTISETDAKVRDAITETANRIQSGQAQLNEFAVMDYQGVNGADMAWHAQAMRDLNASIPALTPDDTATVHMVNTLLDQAMVAAQDLERMEGRKLDIAKRLKDFESGAESVGDVITHKIADGWRQMLPELIDPNGPDAVVIAEELARAISNMDAALRKPESWGLIDQFTRLFKTYATATPGFHVRNLMSGIFMNYVDNVRTGAMIKAVRVWDRFMRDPFGYFDSLPENSDERRALMVVFGSGAAGQFIDTGALNKGFGQPGSRLMNNVLTRWNQRAGSRVEGALRLGMALDSMAKGQNIAAALERVTRYHFDYSRLSTFDHTARRLIPFWTFMSRNIPLQIESMWLRPATYLHYQSFVRNFGEAADPLTPDYWLSQGAFTMDTNAAERDNPWYLAPDLPFLRVAEPLDALAKRDFGRAFLSNFNPVIAAPVEAFAAGKKFYSGAPIEEKYNEPTAAMRALMPLFALLGGTKTGGESGDLLLDDRYAHIARSVLPPLNLLERLTDTSGPREGRTDETALRILGAPVYQLNDALRRSTAAGRYYDRRDAARAAADLARK